MSTTTTPTDLYQEPSRPPRQYAAVLVRPTSQTVSVVIPARNEAENIGWVLGRIPHYVDEVIVVDGDSTDGTIDRARAARRDAVIVGQTGPGKGTALRDGFARSSGEIVVMIDADGSMDPTEIDRYVALLSNGYDFVKGSRFTAGGGSTDITPVRRLGNAGFRLLVNVLYSVRFTDLCYGFVGFRRECLPALDLSAEGFEIETQLSIRAIATGLRICEVPSMELPRRSGQSNLRPTRDGLRVMRTLLKGLVAERPAVAAIPLPAGSAPAQRAA